MLNDTSNYSIKWTSYGKSASEVKDKEGIQVSLCGRSYDE